MNYQLDKQYNGNSQQHNDFYQNMQSTASSGISMILSRYKSNSKIISFPCWFRKAIRKLNIQLEKKELYCGNASDLWGLLEFQLKAISSILAQNYINVALTKKYIEFGQIYLLSKCKQKINEQLVKQFIENVCKQKLKNLQLQLKNCVNIKTKRSIISSSFYENPQIVLLQKADWTKLQNLLTNFEGGNLNQNQIKNQLSNTLKTIIKTTKKYANDLPSSKTKWIILLICTQLLFILKNTSWQIISLSYLNISNMIFNFLSQNEGILKVSKFLHDASQNMLIKQFQLQNSSFIKTKNY